MTPATSHPVKLSKASKKYKTARTESKTTRAALDATVRAASAGGMSYREIAREIGLSVAWVQLSLTRSGVIPRD